MYVCMVVVMCVVSACACGMCSSGGAGGGVCVVHAFMSLSTLEPSD
jgi:hypothetical protein